jgi:cell division protein FtsI/penicillin-binding protein 2
MATHEERRRVGIRLSVLQYLITVVFSGLAVSFWVLQVVQHAKFQEIAENNHQRTLALRAPRGVLFDRDGVVLVENRHSYGISIVREHTKDLNRTVRLLASVLGIEPPRTLISPDHDRAGRDAGAGRRRHSAAPRFRAAGRRRRTSADETVPDRCHGGAPVRIRRRGE